VSPGRHHGASYRDETQQVVNFRPDPQLFSEYRIDVESMERKDKQTIGCFINM
jgi:hypothetical protein